MVTNDHTAECCEATHLDHWHQKTEPKTIVEDSRLQELVEEWYTPLIMKVGSDIFRMHDTYTYSLWEANYTPTTCLVRKIGDEFYCITVDELMDYPDLAYNHVHWIVHSIGTLLLKQSTTLMLPKNKNTTNIQGEFVAW